jgi:uncharacterized protein YoxC
MALGYLISLVILATAFILLIVIGFIAAKKVKPTLTYLKETQEVVNDHIDHFTKEADAVQIKVNNIVERVEKLQTDAEQRMVVFDQLSHHASDLGDALNHLNNERADLTKGIAKNTFNELKTDGPRILKTFQLAIKRTYQKQKARQNEA